MQLGFGLGDVGGEEWSLSWSQQSHALVVVDTGATEVLDANRCIQQSGHGTNSSTVSNTRNMGLHRTRGRFDTPRCIGKLCSILTDGIANVEERL